MRTRNKILIGAAVVAILAVAGVVVVPRLLSAGVTRAAGTGALPQAGGATAQVTTLTLVTSLESTGSVEALQSESAYWKTTGTVATVNVEVGDQVKKKGDVLMTIDPATAPQSVIQAYVELVSAQEALDALLNPSALTIASAQQAVTEVEQTLKDARQDLKYAESPVGQSLYDAVSEAELALKTAKGNAELSRVGSEATEVKTTLDDMNLAYSRLQRAQTAMDDCIKISCGERVRVENELNNAQNTYQTAWDAYQTALLKLDLTTSNVADDVVAAQEDYGRAVANLNAALAGPDALTLKAAQDAVAVAEADLADKQETLNELLNGADPDDLAAAQANVMAAQATIDSLTLRVPFDAEVLQVNFRPGDSAGTSEAAVLLANRSQLHVDVSVDESDISQVSADDTATLTFDALPDLTLTGRVGEVVRYGETVNGLVKYTVRVDFEQVDPLVLIGMTANASIVTDTTEGALAIPVDAVQQDDQGEYVSRVKADGTVEKVKIVSGSLGEDDLVVVTGDLKPGDVVRLAAASQLSSSSNERGPGGPGCFGP